MTNVTAIVVPVEQDQIKINGLAQTVFEQNKASGWWTNIETGENLESKKGEPPKRNIPEMLMLVVSEVVEGLEGHRKNLMDDKLPHRPMLEVELADAVIRILDMCGGLGLDLQGAIYEKLAYNAQRADKVSELVEKVVLTATEKFVSEGGSMRDILKGDITSKVSSK